MNSMYLNYFTNDEDFPFYIQYGEHYNELFSHDHADFSELVIVLNGTAMHYVNDEVYLIKKGDVFVVNSGTVHGFKNAADFHICNIMYRPEIMISDDLDIHRTAGYHALFVIEPYLTKSHGFGSRLTLTLDDFKQVSTVISQMIDEYDKKPEGWKTFIQTSFISLILNFSRKYKLSTTDTEPSAINIAKSVSYIENNFAENLSIEWLAAFSNLSVRHFMRIFKSTYNITPVNYILSVRMTHARRLLTESDYNISEIAYKVGFNDSNYFSRQFKNFFELTPKEYRNIKINKNGEI